jgi:hypothetical protein
MDMSFEDRAFCVAIEVDGLDQREAYKQVYKIEGSNNLSALASRKANHPKIKKYREQLVANMMKKITSRGVWTKEKALDKLIGIGEQAEQYIIVEDVHKADTANVAIKAYAEANKVAGLNTENINHSGEISLERLVDSLSDDEDIPDVGDKKDDE